VAAEAERRWKLGGRVTDAGHHDCLFVRDLSQVEADELKAKFREVHELAEQNGLTRVLESGDRWGAVLDAAQEEIELDGAISPQSERAAQLELGAFVRFCERLVEELRAEATASETRPEPQAAFFAERLEQLQRTGPYALLVEAFEEGKIEADLLQLRKTLDPLYVRGFETYSARDLVAATLGGLIELVVAHFVLRESAYRALADELRPLTRSVPKGMPSLFSFIESGAAKPSNYELTDFPVFALARLDHAFDEVRAGRGQQAILELLQGRYRRILRFGKASADSAAVGGTSSEGLDALPTATVQLDVDLLGSEPIDYWAPMSDRVEEGGEGREMFLGVVQRADPDGRLVTLDCEGAAALTEQVAGGTLAANMEPAELIRAMIARSGWDGELLLQEEKKEHLPEVFDVISPLHGIEVDKPLRMGTISIVPREQEVEKIGLLEKGEPGETGAEMIAEFREADSFAVAQPTAQTVDAAEDEGLGEIDIALAWLTTRGRYGAVALPDGSPQLFDRQQALRAPHRGPVVYVCGAETKRLWLRRPAEPDRAIKRCLSDDDSSTAPPLPVKLEVNDRLALLALRLAASEADPLMQVRALWQAIESYAEKRKGERRLFTKREKKAIKKLVLDHADLDLSKRQRDRLKEAIDGLNHESLTLRLRRRLKRDAVLVTDDELALLDELYDIRNDIVHGRPVEQPPQRDQINYGISIVSRMLVHRIASLGQGEVSDVVPEDG